VIGSRSSISVPLLGGWARPVSSLKVDGNICSTDLTFTKVLTSED
jgi:hypothetical protein